MWFVVNPVVGIMSVVCIVVAVLCVAVVSVIVIVAMMRVLVESVGFRVIVCVGSVVVVAGVVIMWDVSLSVVILWDVSLSVVIVVVVSAVVTVTHVSFPVGALLSSFVVLPSVKVVVPMEGAIVPVPVSVPLIVRLYISVLELSVPVLPGALVMAPVWGPSPFSSVFLHTLVYIENVFKDNSCFFYFKTFNNIQSDVSRYFSSSGMRMVKPEYIHLYIYVVYGSAQSPLVEILATTFKASLRLRQAARGGNIQVVSVLG